MKILCKLGFHDYKFNIFVRCTPQSNGIRCTRCGKQKPLIPNSNGNVK